MFKTSFSIQETPSVGLSNFKKRKKMKSGNVNGVMVTNVLSAVDRTLLYDYLAIFGSFFFSFKLSRLERATLSPSS